MITEQVIDFDLLKANEADLTWDKLSFDFMIGFDQLLSLDIGRISIELLTYEDGKLVQTESVPSGLCDFDHPGLKTAENDLQMVFGDDFALICPKAPQLTKTTGNKQQNSFK